LRRPRITIATANHQRTVNQTERESNAPKEGCKATIENA
jgi:hypothetical protein